MTRTQPTKEAWESTNSSTVYVSKINARGVVTQSAVGGAGNPRRIQLSSEDRIFNEEANPDNNPFINGQLRRVDGVHKDEEQPGKTDAQLLGVLQESDLEETLMEWPELSVRRLFFLAEGDGQDKFRLDQFATLKEVISTRWPHRSAPQLQTDILGVKF